MKILFLLIFVERTVSTLYSKVYENTKTPWISIGLICLGIIYSGVNADLKMTCECLTLIF